MKGKKLVFLSTFLLVIPCAVLAQEIGDIGMPIAPDNTIWDTIKNIVVPLLGVVGGSSIVSAFVRSNGGPIRTFIMAIVDALAFNWLKARNDPSVNK